MTIITIAAAGIATVLLAVQLKGLKGEYAAYMVMAAGAFIFFYGTGKLKDILEALERIRSEERRVGKECLRLCRSRWSPYH